MICTGVTGSNYNYRIKITIENNTSKDIGMVFHNLSMNTMEMAGSPMLQGVIQKGTKEDFEVKTGILGILTGDFTVGDSTGHNFILTAENLSVDLKQVPKLS